MNEKEFEGLISSEIIRWKRNRQFNAFCGGVCTFVKSMPKDNRYDKDGKPLANKFVINLAKQTRDNIDAYLLDLYLPDLLI